MLMWLQKTNLDNSKLLFASIAIQVFSQFMSLSRSCAYIDESLWVINRIQRELFYNAVVYVSILIDKPYTVGGNTCVKINFAYNELNDSNINRNMIIGTLIMVSELSSNTCITNLG